MKYSTVDGKSFTDHDIDSWCEHYDKGEFLPNSQTTNVISGKPAHTAPKSATITIKVPVGMKVALNKKAEQQGVTTSAYIRSALLKASL